MGREERGRGGGEMRVGAGDTGGVGSGEREG